MKGFDTPYSVVNKAHDILHAGYDFVIRYISPNTHTFSHKCMSLGEVTGLHSVGLKIGSVWETQPTSISYFNGNQGTKDAEAAVKTVKALGQPTGSAIYWTVDYDASKSDILGPILEYAKAFHTVCSKHNYLTGIYGSGLAIHTIQNLGWAHFTWLAQSMGWTNSRNYKTADINQGPSTTILGLDVDSNILNSKNAGLW